MMISRNSLAVIQLNDSHTYFDLHQEMFWQGGKAAYRPAGGYARRAALVKQIRAANPEREQVVARKYGRNRQQHTERSIDELRAYLAGHRPLREELRGTFVAV